jgi:hypothetical protein
VFIVISFDRRGIAPDRRLEMSARLAPPSMAMAVWL